MVNQNTPQSSSNSSKEQDLPFLISATASVQSKAKNWISIYDPESHKKLNRGELKYFNVRPQEMQEAVFKLKGSGFSVVNLDKSCIQILGTRLLFEKTFQIKIERGQKILAVLPNSQKSAIINQLPLPWSNLLNEVVLSQLAQFEDNFDAIPPPPGKKAGNKEIPSNALVPADISVKLKRNTLQQAGDQIPVVLVDSGFYIKHPYFKALKPTVNFPDLRVINRLREIEKKIDEKFKKNIKYLTADYKPTRDDSGHGTMVLTNLLAVAPKAKISAYKTPLFAFQGKVDGLISEGKDPYIIEYADMSTYLWNILIYSDFRHLVEKGSIISISMSILNSEPEINQRLRHQIIASQERNNFIFLFPTGRGYYPELNYNPQQLFYSEESLIPEVISVGGAYYDENGTLKASNHATGASVVIKDGNSNTTRVIPDICGLCGPSNTGYLIYPTDKYADLKSREETDSWYSKGWEAGSGGTSAATPQIAGVVALIRQVFSNSNADQIKKILKATATPIESGKTANGVEMASLKVGLANIEKAVLLAHGINSKNQNPAPEIASSTFEAKLQAVLSDLSK